MSIWWASPCPLEDPPALVPPPRSATTFVTVWRTSSRLAANSRIASASSPSPTKCRARLIAMSRRMILSRSGRPRSGSSTWSRSGGRSRSACSADGGGRGSQESQRRQRCQRTPPPSRTNTSSSGRTCRAPTPSRAWPAAPQTSRSQWKRGTKRRGRSRAPGASGRDRLLGDRLDDVVTEGRVLLQVLRALGLQLLDDLPVLVGAAELLVELLRPQDRVVVLDARHRPGHVVAEVRIFGPLDLPLGDRLDDRGAVLDPDLLRALDGVGAAHAAGVHQVDVQVVLAHELQEAVALVVVVGREERVGARDAQELAGLLGAARARALRLAEHEVGRGLLGVQL